MYINIYKCIINLINFLTATISFVPNVAGDLPDLQAPPQPCSIKTKQIVTTQDLIIMIIITIIIIIITKIILMQSHINHNNNNNNNYFVIMIAIIILITIVRI